MSRRPTWQDLVIVVGGVYGPVHEHVAQLRAEGVDDGAAAYAISKAMERAMRGEVPGPAAVSMEAYRAGRARIGHACYR